MHPTVTGRVLYTPFEMNKNPPLKINVMVTVTTAEVAYRALLTKCFDNAYFVPLLTADPKGKEL